MLVWRPTRPVLSISSGPLGGGIGPRGWVLNATVPMSYRRSDPDQHLMEIAAGFGLSGPGVGMLTGVNVVDFFPGTDGGVASVATVGLGAPVRAAAPESGPETALPDAGAGGGGAPGQVSHHVGTINVIAFVPARLSEAALVNAVSTVVEAKAQALWDLGLAATGTCTDAVFVGCPPSGPAEPYGGPRSTWGARLARAVHAAVLTGGRAWLGDPRSWSARQEATRGREA